MSCFLVINIDGLGLGIVIERSLANDIVVAPLCLDEFRLQSLPFRLGGVLDRDFELKYSNILAFPVDLCEDGCDTGVMVFQQAWDELDVLIFIFKVLVDIALKMLFICCFENISSSLSVLSQKHLDVGDVGFFYNAVFRSGSDLVFGKFEKGFQSGVMFGCAIRIASLVFVVFLACHDIVPHRFHPR